MPQLTDFQRIALLYFIGPCIFNGAIFAIRAVIAKNRRNSR